MARTGSPCVPGPPGARSASGKPGMVPGRCQEPPGGSPRPPRSILRQVTKAGRSQGPWSGRGCQTLLQPGRQIWAHCACQVTSALGGGVACLESQSHSGEVLGRGKPVTLTWAVLPVPVSPDWPPATHMITWHSWSLGVRREPPHPRGRHGGKTATRDTQGCGTQAQPAGLLPEPPGTGNPGHPRREGHTERARL